MLTAVTVVAVSAEALGSVVLFYSSGVSLHFSPRGSARLRSNRGKPKRAQNAAENQNSAIES